MPHDVLVTGAQDADITIVLAHGAGSAMDTASVENMSSTFADRGQPVVRLEFDYMAGRRSTGKRSPPLPAEPLAGI
ncbi:alpha/beta family hydrolase [Rhizobium sp. P40RR-XXII]|uniref:alpha/beta family hydrolase n=1 Tax=unclassified Rhizobium TaxID=2613769 RepID=UPI0039185E6B